MSGANGQLSGKTTTELEVIDLTPAYRRPGGPRKVDDRHCVPSAKQQAVLDAAARVASGGEQPTIRAVADALGEPGPAAYHRTASLIYKLREKGLWPHDSAPSPPSDAEAEPESRPRSSIDEEISAIARCADVLGLLDPEARRRVWRYLADRFAAELEG